MRFFVSSLEKEIGETKVSALNYVDYFVHPEISAARYLPASAFTSNDILQRELDTIFRKTWLLVPCGERSESAGGSCVTTELCKRRGAYTPITINEKSFFLQRDYKGELHCFSNACTHAVYKLVRSSGFSKDRKIVCAQHGRQFDLEGKCISHAEFQKMKDFPSEDDHLRAFSVHEWEQFAFVAPGNPVGSAEEFLGPMIDSVRALPIGAYEYKPQQIEERIVEGNWKHHAYNYLDKYHIPFIHRAPGGLADAVTDYVIERHKYSTLQWAYARDPRHGFEPHNLSDRFRDPTGQGRRVFALWWLIFPNITFNFYPWGLSVNIYEPVVDDPHKTRFRWYHFVGDVDKYALRDKYWLNKQVDDEDVDAVKCLSQGVRSPFSVRGRFVPSEERGPHWFHRLVYEFLFEK